MAEQDDARFQGPPSLPTGVTIDDAVVDLYDNLKAQVEGFPDGPERDEAMFALRALVERVRGIQQVHVEAEFVESPTNTITQFTDHRGRAAIRETDGYGNVRTTTMSKEDTAKVEAGIKERIDTREQADVLRDQVKRTRALASEASAMGSTGVAAQLNAEAGAKSAEATALLDGLREQIPPEEWRDYDLGPAPEPALEGVQEALDALHAGKTNDVYEMTRAFGQAEMYQFMSRVPKEDEKFVDILLAKSEDEETARRQQVGF